MPGIKLTKGQIISLAESVQEDFKSAGDAALFDIQPTNLHNGETIVLQAAAKARDRKRAIFVSRRGRRQEMTG